MEGGREGGKEGGWEGGREGGRVPSCRAREWDSSLILSRALRGFRTALSASLMLRCPPGTIISMSSSVRSTSCCMS
jgi:hypothetical protein